MKIRKDQQSVIDSLIVERISDNDTNIRILDGFENKHVNEKKCALRNNAAQDDENGITAYYLVKDPGGNLMFYFSLKCGMLYDGPLFASLNSGNEEFKKYLKDRGIEYADTRYAQDVAIERNELIYRGESTFSAIELAHFYKNENYKLDEWRRKYDLPQVGTIMFWNFVVPQVLAARKHVGCQYLYLFAADDSEDRKLVNYYADKLKFRTQMNVGTVKPLYDYECEFMCQEIASLQEKREKFFGEEFNIDSDIV